jgi:hypothetical protein
MWVSYLHSSSNLPKLLSVSLYFDFTLWKITCQLFTRLFFSLGFSVVFGISWKLYIIRKTTRSDVSFECNTRGVNMFVNFCVCVWCWELNQGFCACWGNDLPLSYTSIPIPFFLRWGCPYIAQTGLELLGLSALPASGDFNFNYLINMASARFSM